MKTNLWLALLLVGLAGNAPGAIYNYTWTVSNGAIPDASPSGLVDNRTIVTGTPDFQGNYLPANPVISSVVNVHINVSGGWNGDLQAYLRYQPQNGTTAFTTLLNRVGTTEANPIGYTTPGMDIKLSGDASFTDIHSVPAPTGGETYRVDQSGGNNDFVSFSGLDPTSGTWSLFFADLSGQHTSQLNSWGLQLSVVPEPTTWALIAFGAVFAAAQLARSCRRRLAVAPAPPFQLEYPQMIHPFTGAIPAAHFEASPPRPYRKPVPQGLEDCGA